MGIINISSVNEECQNKSIFFIPGTENLVYFPGMKVTNWFNILVKLGLSSDGTFQLTDGHSSG